MTVKEAIALLSYGTAYEIRGAYDGKTYHKSYVNSSKNLDKYAEQEVTAAPFYPDMRMRGSDTNRWIIPVIVVWMHDYELRRGKVGQESEVKKDVSKTG